MSEPRDGMETPREAIERQLRERGDAPEHPYVGPPVTPLQERAMMLVFGDIKLESSKPSVDSRGGSVADPGGRSPISGVGSEGAHQDDGSQ